MMRWDYQMENDPDARAMYVYLPNHPRMARSVARTVEVGHGLSLDYGHNGSLIGIELLYAPDSEVFDNPMSPDA